ncbi:MAG TPA: aldo/keto reductase [Sphingomicrobium sp.]|nr:aldo/keto reductase [Sphingomicrobium sp.]
MPRRLLGRTGLEVSVIGLGLAPLGNLYRAISDADAEDTVATAIKLGIRYFDTAPYYGFGLSERRAGGALRGLDDIIISTKVGRLLGPKTDETSPAERHGFVSPMPFEPRFDYSHDGILRSYEQSLDRLRTARIDILLIHDIGRTTHGAEHDQRLAQLVDGGGLVALQRLRDEGSVSAIGLGVNEIDVCFELLDRAELDVILLAGRYTLLEQAAIGELLPHCIEERVSIVIGGPFNSGILASGSSASGARYNYVPATTSVRERVKRLERTCATHRVPLAAAALQFPLAHPAVAAVIPGFASAAEVRLGIDHFETPIPAALWSDLLREGLIDERAPVPGPKLEEAAS